jgi:hypothetical protein
MPTTPYLPVDRSVAPITSYPVAKVRDAVKDLHVDVLTNARTEFPTVEALEANPVFAALKEAVHPNPHLLTPDPVPDADHSLADAFGVAEISFGGQPGSHERPPTLTSITPTSGPSYGGNVVTVHGTDFIGQMTVNFGTVWATEVVRSSSTSLTCRAPDWGAPGGAVDVTVRTGAGESPVTPAGRYTFVAPPPPALAPDDDPNTPNDPERPITPSSTHGGSQTDVHIYGTNFVGPTKVYFGPSEATRATNVRLLSDTELVCDAPVLTPTYPPGSSTPFQITVNVTVQTEGGETGSSPFNYFVPSIR